MATPTVVGGLKIKLKLGDGASPEVFATICGVTTTNVEFTKAMNDVDLPDCADDNAISWLGREPQNRSAQITAEGVLHTPGKAALQAWFDDNDGRNVQLWIDTTSALGGGYWSGVFHLSQFNVGGARGNKATINLTIVSDGSIAWTAAP